MTRSPVNRRDPSGTRKIEREEIKRQRELISAYTEAMARMAAGDDPDRMMVIERLSQDLREDLLSASDNWIKRTSDSTVRVTDKILNNLHTGIKLGNVPVPREEVEALRMNIRTQVSDLAGDTLSSVTRIMTEGYQEGLGADEIARRIRSEVPEEVGSRAERIVRTETMRTCDMVAKARYEAAGCDGYVSFPTDDDRLCDACVRHATGGSGSTTLKVYGKNEAMALPWHPNCRCMRLPHFEGQEISL